LAKNATPALLLIKAEASDERKYCCKVVTKQTIKQKCIKLEIIGNQTSNETGDMTLSCHATGKPTPNITWSKQGNKEWNHTGTLLPLKNISRDQHGDYWCTAENNAGHVSASVTVTVNYAPSITISAKRYNVTEGDDKDIECISDGRPPPMVTWTKIGGLSNNIHARAQWLTFRKASRNESGTYTCTAANGIGKQAIATVDVNVLCKFLSDVALFAVPIHCN